MDLSADLSKKIGMALGREISPAEQGNVASFLAFTEADIADLRILEKKSGVMAVAYIRYRLKEGVTLDQAVSYYASVIQQGMPVSDWVNPG